MSISKKFIFSFFCVIGCAASAFGQATRSPFSALGIGEYYGNALAHNQGMAGVAYSNPQFFYLNSKNPALLVFNTLTVFESGILGEKRTLKDGTAVEKNGSGNLNYLALGFPIKRGKWATSTGLMPYTAVNYKLNYTDNIIGSTNQVAVEESGKGGINQVFWAHGVALNEDFSLGVRANYLFGSINTSYANYLLNSDQGVGFKPYVSERYYYKDYNFSGGFSFHRDSISKQNLRINIGVVYEFASNVNTNYYQKIFRPISLSDTISYAVARFNSSTTIPRSIGFGASVSKADNLTIGFDAQYLQYSQFKDILGQNASGIDVWRLALGSEYTPYTSGPGSYLKRMTYRTGVSLDQYPYLVNGNALKDFGINFGLSLPVGRVSSMDFALKIGKRGDLTLNKIEENYIKLYFGVTFNDQWFIKRRFD